ncbi:hypothetical protein [Phocaeicola faecalis]
MNRDDFMAYLSEKGLNIDSNTYVFPENDKNPFYVQTNCTIFSCLQKIETIISAMEFFNPKDDNIMNSLQVSSFVDIFAYKIALSDKIMLPRKYSEFARNIFLHDTCLSEYVNNKSILTLARYLCNEDIIERVLRNLLSVKKGIEFLNDIFCKYEQESDKIEITKDLFIQLLLCKFLIRISTLPQDVKSEASQFGIVYYDPKEVLGGISENFTKYILHDISYQMDSGNEIHLPYKKIFQQILGKEKSVPVLGTNGIIVSFSVSDSDRKKVMIGDIKDNAQNQCDKRPTLDSFIKDLFIKGDSLKEGEEDNRILRLKNEYVIQLSVPYSLIEPLKAGKSILYQPLTKMLSLKKPIKDLLGLTNEVEIEVLDIEKYDQQIDSVKNRGYGYLSWRCDKEDRLLDDILTFDKHPMYATFVCNNEEESIPKEVSIYGDVCLWLDKKFKNKAKFRASATSETCNSFEELLYSLFKLDRLNEVWQYEQHVQREINYVEVVIQEDINIPQDIDDAFHIEMKNGSECTYSRINWQ